jgi:lysophospholipase L1-like esterase
MRCSKALKTITAVSAGIALFLAGASVAVARPERGATEGAKQYYLALGDSLVFGLQPAKAEKGLPPSGFRTGFVDVFAARLRGAAPKLRVVNYGCPGETTKTFIAGGCPWLPRPLHDSFKRSQLAGALAFLRAHRNQVSPITLTLYGNDVAELTDACHDDIGCIKRRAPAALAQFGSRLSRILGRIRAAAPGAVIVVTGGWNFNVDDLNGTDPLVRAANAATARSAASVHARFADLFSVFSPPGAAARKARLCKLTFVCRGDPHPTDAGYRAMGAAVFAASGF